jgi:hypothetical protein
MLSVKLYIFTIYMIMFIFIELDLMILDKENYFLDIRSF